MNKVKSILITGINGFVGTHLNNFLKYNLIYQITGITRTQYNHNSCITNKTYSQLFEENKQYHIYIHLAGKAHDLNNKGTKYDFYEANYELTKKMFDLFLKDKDSKKFIYLSSMSVVDNNSDIYLSEHVQCKPNGFYGHSKREAEIYITKHLKDHHNKKVYILRAPMIHGPNNKGNLNLLCNIVKNNIPWPLGSFNNKRSFLSIANFNYVINRLINEDINSGIYHISDDLPLSTNDIVKMIYTINNKNINIYNLPKSLVYFFASVGDILRLPFNTRGLNKVTENFLVSNNKIKKALDIQKMSTNPYKSMETTIKSLIIK